MSQAEQDTNDSPRSVEELQQALDRLDILIEATLDGIYDWNVETRGVWHSERLTNLLGYTEAEMPVDIKQWESLVHPDDLAGTLDAMDDHFERGVPYVADYRMRTKDGGYRWFNDQGHAIRNEHGKAVRLVGSLHDITDRVEAQARNSRLGRIVENSLNEIYVLDAETFRFIDVNRAARANLQYTVEELKQFTPADFVPDQTPETLKELMAPLVAGEKDVVDIKSVHRRKDSTTYDATVRIQFSGDESPPIFVGFVRDITEHLESEARTSRLGRIVENSVNEIYLFDAKTPRFRQVNSGARTNLGYSVSELADLTPLDLKPEFTWEQFEALIEALRTGEESQINFETVHRRKDGTTYDVAVRLQLMAQESPPVFVAFIEDVTEQKKSDAELAIVHERLRASDKLFRSMTANVPGAIYRSLSDENWTDVYLSDAIEEITGYPASDFIGAKVRTFDSIVHPDDLENYMDASINWRDDPYVTEYRILHAGGEVRWVQDRSRAMCNDAGDPIWIDGAIVDITAQKQIEQSLAERDLQYLSIVANVPGAIYRCLPDGDWTDIYMSDVIEEITGYPASDFIDNKARNLKNLVHPDDLEKYLEPQPRDEMEVEEYRIIHADGGVRWIHDRSQMVCDDSGEPAWIDGALFDITPQKRTEEALAESEAEYRSMVANVPGAIYRGAVDDDWTMDFLTDAIEDITGYRAADLVDNKLRSYGSLILPEDFSRLQEQMGPAIDT